MHVQYCTITYHTMYSCPTKKIPKIVHMDKERGYKVSFQTTSFRCHYSLQISSFNNTIQQFVHTYISKNTFWGSTLPFWVCGSSRYDDRYYLMAHWLTPPGTTTKSILTRSALYLILFLFLRIYLMLKLEIWVWEYLYRTMERPMFM